MRIEKDDILDCAIDDVGIYGEGIAHAEGQTVFIPGAIAGERVRAKAVLVKPTFVHAVLQEITEVSPDRVPPPCPYFKQCGGCSLQHVAYARQLEIKRGILENAMRKIAGIGLSAAPTIPSDKQYRYRNKISLPVRFLPEKDKPVYGFFARRTHRIVEIADCLLQKEETVAAALQGVRFALAHGCKGYDEAAGRGDLRHVTARTLDGVTALTFVLNEENSGFTRALKGIDQSMFDGAAIFLNYNEKNNNVILGENTHTVRAPKTSRADGLITTLHPKSFYQVNDDVRSKLYAFAVGELPSGCVAVDAYSGAGVMSALAAKKAAHVFAVELVQEAVDSAKRLKAENDIENMELVCGDCGEVLGGVLARAAAAASGGEVSVILDPPKTGCGKRVTDALASDGANVNKIVYVSCNPATLARDAAQLASGGFTLQKLQPFDMFPNTMAVETIAVFTK